MLKNFIPLTTERSRVSSIVVKHDGEIRSTGSIASSAKKKKEKNKRRVRARPEIKTVSSAAWQRFRNGDNRQLLSDPRESSSLPAGFSPSRSATINVESNLLLGTVFCFNFAPAMEKASCSLLFDLRASSMTVNLSEERRERRGGN